MHIRILATTDLHMTLTGFDYYADKPDPTIGLTRTASAIRNARQQAEDGLTLLFDNGDALQGTPIGDWAIENDGPHPMMQAFKALEYDAIGLGNHDFGFGLDVLERVITQAPCPVICSNLNHVNDRQPWLRSVVLTRSVAQEETIRIGVFSVLPPQTTMWEAHHLKDTFIAEDILTAARRTAEALRAQGCDLVIALAHSGLEQSTTQPGLENAVIPLAEIEGIDAIVAGHTHLTLPGAGHLGLDGVDAENALVHGTPVVMAGSAGSFLGVMDLRLTKSPEGRWQITDRHCDLVETADEVEDKDLNEMFKPAHLATRKMMAEPVSHTKQSLHSYFSFCAPDRGLALVAAAQAAGLRPFLHGNAFAGVPLLSAVSPCKFGGRAGPRNYTDVPVGEICLRHVADLHVFPNELRAVDITGAQLRDWLEMSAGVFNQIHPDAEAEITDSRRAGHNFDVVFGVTYQIDLSSPARFDSNGALTDPTAQRVRDLCFGGQIVRDDQSFVVALNNYRASGGGHFPFVTKARAIPLPSRDIKEILRDYLSDRLLADPLDQAPYPFSLAPLYGTHTILRTGSGALKYLPELNEYSPELLGPDTDGFERIRLTL